VVLVNGWYILGEEVKAFENNFASYCGTIALVGNGDALTSFLKAIFN
jgi:dTDP-4-amino-4,6-dideoxygalactose transaminase